MSIYINIAIIFFIERVREKGEWRDCGGVDSNFYIINIFLCYSI